MCRLTWRCDIQLSRLFTDRYWQLLHQPGSAPSPIPFIGLMNDDTHILIEITSKEDWGGNVSLNFYSQENEEDTFVFFLWKTWYEFSFRFHRFQILQWAIAPGTTCLWIKDFEGNHENIHFIACCMKYLLYLSSVSKFNFLWHNGHKRPSTFYQILAKRTLYSKLKRIPPIWAISKMANRIQWDWRPPRPINLFIFETTTSFFKYGEVSQVWNEIYEVVFSVFLVPKKANYPSPWS